MKKSIIIAISVGVLAAGAGSGVGVYLAHELKPPISITEGLNGADYEADLSAAWKKYSKAKASGNFVESMTPDELINCSYKVYDEKEKHHAMTVGYSIASTLGLDVNQRILGTFIKDGNNFFEEQSSSSKLVNLNNRFWQDEKNTLCYWGKDANWDNYKPSTVTNEEYQQLMGSNVSRSLRYIVSDKTIIYGKLNNTSLGLQTTRAIKNSETNEIVVDAELDTMKTVCYYGQQMKTMSDLYAPPTFKYIHLIVTMDAVDLFPKSMVVYEGYTATLSSGISSPCDSRCKTVYYSDGTESMPELHAKFEYPDEL